VRTALFSDVHGNAVAFDAFLADLSQLPVDRIVCLGDIIQGGAEPVKCLEGLRKLGCPVVLGNADWYVLTGETAEPETEQQREVREWTLAQLTDDDIAYVHGFTRTVGLPGLLAFHGSPTSFDEIILPSTPEADFRRMLEGADAPVMAGGHVHLPFLRRLGEALFVNPGSVGLAYDHEQPGDGPRLDPWAQYAIVTDVDGVLSVEFRRVPFDPTLVVASYVASGAPHLERAAAWQPQG
jgi:predicted phosphodiesterase